MIRSIRKARCRYICGHKVKCLQISNGAYCRARAKSAAVTNTRKESIFEKKIWTESFRRRRCLLPATSFFEPATINGKKHQMEFKLKDAEVFAFPGLWSKTELFGDPRNCCSLITCEPNEIVGEVHGRMPVILRPEHFDTYLNTPPEQAEQLLDLLIPYPSELMDKELESKEPTQKEGRDRES